jgi:hypothetical protein
MPGQGADHVLSLLLPSGYSPAILMVEQSGGNSADIVLVEQLASVGSPNLPAAA